MDSANHFEVSAVTELSGARKIRMRLPACGNHPWPARVIELRDLTLEEVENLQAWLRAVAAEEDPESPKRCERIYHEVRTS